MSDLNELLGVPVIFSRDIPRPGIVVFDPGAIGNSGVMFATHPDEEPHLWAQVGKTNYALLKLKSILTNKIRMQTWEAEKKLDAMVDKLNSPEHLLFAEIMRDLERV